MTDYSFGICKQIADFVRHKLEDCGPYGLQLIVTKENGRRFSKSSFRIDIYTENAKGEQISKVFSGELSESGVIHITDLADAFRIELK